jgi:hypothetical protein
VCREKRISKSAEGEQVRNHITTFIRLSYSISSLHFPPALQSGISIIDPAGFSYPFPAYNVTDSLFDTQCVPPSKWIWGKRNYLFGTIMMDDVVVLPALIGCLTSSFAAHFRALYKSCI